MQPLSQRSQRAHPKDESIHKLKFNERLHSPLLPRSSYLHPHQLLASCERNRTGLTYSDSR